MTETPDRTESVFAAAVALAAADERAAYLEQACAGDAALRGRVEALLRAHARAGHLLDRPVPGGPELTGAYTSGALPGTVIAGRYKLLEEIGEGGMGTVWVAEQTQPVRRKVALKLIKAGMDSKAVLARFEAERQALAVMDHPNIAKVLDGGTTGGEPGGVSPGRPFFVMEYVKGVPMTEYCETARLSVPERLQLFVQVCSAVQHAHQKGIIHRDLKPSNILVAPYDDRPVPKVIDFGLAKALHQPLTERTLHTAHEAVLGTPLYMSPEQAQLNNLDVDTRSDIYSLGVLLYELLTGTTPLEKKRFKDAAWEEIKRLIREEEPPKPSTRLSSTETLPSLAACRQTEPGRLKKLVRGELDWIVMKALEKDRNRRYETANGFARDIERHLADEPVEACPPSVGYRLRKLVRRNKARVIAGGLFGAMLLLVVGLVLYGIWWAERQSAERRHEQALTAARSNDALKATLDQTEAGLKSARLGEAATLLGQADKQLDEQTPTELRERHERLKRDERAARELEDIFEERWMVSPSDTRIDSERAKRRYPPLFHGYGLAVGAEPAAATVAKVRQSVIAETLSAGLTEWFFVEPGYQGLLAVVDLLDPEQARAALRAALVSGENDRAHQASKAIDGSQLPAAYAIGLATHLNDADSLRILKAAWTAHPDSFPLALTINARSCSAGDELAAEAIGWGRTAVSLRPNNPLAHYYLAGALSQRRHPDVANVEAELRRTVRLAPRFAKAYGRLAFVLRRHGNDSGAEALGFASKAIELDSQNVLGHFVLYDHLTIEKKDYVEAAREYRLLTKLFSSSRVDIHPSDGSTEAFVIGWTDESIRGLLKGLIDTERPFEAYRLVIEGHPPESMSFILERPHDCPHYFAACAAAQAGTGHGLDAPPLAERAAIRRHALDWLNTSLGIWRQHAAARPALAARTLGLMGSASGQGPLLVTIAAQLPGSPWAHIDPATDYEEICDGMNHWLSDPDLAGVRDDQWLAKLPADEREQWQKLWGEVRLLRDRTAPVKAALPPAGK